MELPAAHSGVRGHLFELSHDITAHSHVLQHSLQLPVIHGGRLLQSILSVRPPLVMMNEDKYRKTLIKDGDSLCLNPLNPFLLYYYHKNVISVIMLTAFRQEPQTNG